MTIRTIGQVADAYENGRYWSGMFRRAGPTMTSSTFTDMTYAAGIPVANYYAATPLTAAALTGREGIYTGPDCNSAGYKKYLHKALLLPVAAIGSAMFVIHDIVMYYPFLDGDGGEQLLDNTMPIPRYNGVGCKMFFVSQGAGTGVSQVDISYTKPDGTAGRTTSCTAVCSSAAGAFVSHAAAGYVSNPGTPYIPLAAGDNGVKSVESVNVLSASGGIFALVIAKPLGVISMLESATTPIEVDFTRDRTWVPEIEDGAYIGLAGVSSTTAAPATLHGQFDFIWG